MSSRSIQKFIKIVLDIVFAASLLLLTSPLLILLIILIPLTSKGAPIFAQDRIGRNSKHFKMYKFRTMYSGSEKSHDKLMTEQNIKGVKEMLHTKNDERVTGLGRSLRHFSLDELPQLWNVLRGHMSLVGPRPLIQAEFDLLTEDQKRFLTVRPGLTGQWQVSGRDKHKNVDKKILLDLEYIDNWSLLLDLKLALQTIPVIIFGIGAE
ncbi:sugar transferase [Candidatus Margulisiibacteriota bacterium]